MKHSCWEIFIVLSIGRWPARERSLFFSVSVERLPKHLLLLPEHRHRGNHLLGGLHLHPASDLWLRRGSWSSQVLVSTVYICTTLWKDASPHMSHLACFTSLVSPHMLHLTCLTSQALPPHMPHLSHLTCLTSHASPYMSHLTCLASHASAHVLY